MFTIRLETTTYAPSRTIVMRWAPFWDLDRGGIYRDGGWEFDLDEIAFPDGITFKFVLVPGNWSIQANVTLTPDQLAGTHTFREVPNDDGTPFEVTFTERNELVTERGVVAQRFFVGEYDPTRVWDVIVVGSGMGGGILASRLADAGKQVLVLEAGSYLFPTHVGNIARHRQEGTFEKQVWSLWNDFKVVNYRNNPTITSNFKGAQGFNLGGRSIYWGGLIPRQTAWELAAWPEAVRTYLLTGGGYSSAEVALNRVPPNPSDYQKQSVANLDALLPGFVAEDAGMAVQYIGATPWSIPAGFFSTADLLLEDRLFDDQNAAHVRPTINLNFSVRTVDKDPNTTRVTGVTGWDSISQTIRSFQANTVVLAAGTIESAKIALQSALDDNSSLIGKGITDHTIEYRHFVLPAGNPYANPNGSAKVLLRDPAATTEHHAFDIVVELGANLNQGRYVDPLDLVKDEADLHGGMLCEIVFMHYAELNPGNSVDLDGKDPGNPVQLTVFPMSPNPANLAASGDLANSFLNAIGALPAPNEIPPLILGTADLGGVAHEVGTLRMSTTSGAGVVDTDLRFWKYENLFACDNSVFPTSPAANPSLTLAALALRLAHHLAD